MRCPEKIQNKIDLAYRKMIALMIGSFALTISKEIPGTRDVLPEPFDVMDHVGNVSGSAQLGCWAGVLAGMYYTHKTNNSDLIPSKNSVRARMAMAGLTIGLVANGIIESKFGMRVVHWENTPDVIDAIYGVGAATAAASLIPSVVEQKVNLITNED